MTAEQGERYCKSIGADIPDYPINYSISKADNYRSVFARLMDKRIAVKGQSHYLKSNPYWSRYGATMVSSMGFTTKINMQSIKDSQGRYISKTNEADQLNIVCFRIVERWGLRDKPPQ